jgi:hypothetical protein
MSADRLIFRENAQIRFLRTTTALRSHRIDNHEPAEVTPVKPTITRQKTIACNRCMSSDQKICRYTVAFASTGSVLPPSAACV